jgi:serine protease Do
MALDELEAAIRETASALGPSVVGVSGGRAHGSGLVVAEGAVLTNAHNLAGAHTEQVTVTFGDGRQAQAEVRGVDPAAALAPSTPEAGAVVFALANPGGRGLRTTFGVLAATDEAFRGPRGRRITGSLEHSAPLPRGSSGGPVADGQGRVIGINTHRLGDGFYLALPVDDALRERVESLSRGESRTRPTLGVALAPAKAARHLRRAVGLPERDGLLVRGVADGSPAHQAGVREGDLLVEAGGRPLTSADELHAALDALPADGTATLALKLVRGVDELDVEVRFGS